MRGGPSAEAGGHTVEARSAGSASRTLVPALPAAAWRSWDAFDGPTLFQPFSLSRPRRIEGKRESAGGHSPLAREDRSWRSLAIRGGPSAEAGGHPSEARSRGLASCPHQPSPRFPISLASKSSRGRPSSMQSPRTRASPGWPPALADGLLESSSFRSLRATSLPATRSRRASNLSLPSPAVEPSSEQPQASFSRRRATRRVSSTSRVGSSPVG